MVDPFSGSGTTAVAACQLGRRFIVNDQSAEYNQMAADRLSRVETGSEESWIEYDKNLMLRRRRLK